MLKECPNCHKQSSSIKSIIARGEIMTGCEHCLHTLRKGHGGAAKYQRDRQRETYRRDILQPNQPRDFVKAYGADVARENGYTDEQVRKYG